MEVHTVQQVFSSCKSTGFREAYSGRIEQEAWEELGAKVVENLAKATKVARAIYNLPAMEAKESLTQVYDEAMRQAALNLDLMGIVIPEFNHELQVDIIGQLAIMEAMLQEYNVLANLADYVVKK